MGSQHATNCIGCCPCCAKPITSVARQYLANPLPFPGERPTVDETPDGLILFYPRGGGISKRPRLGDVRVSFVHIPGGNAKHVFTACGVLRRGGLEPFRFKGPPPRGIAMGGTSPDSFNLGENGEQAFYGADLSNQALAPYGNSPMKGQRELQADEEKALLQKQGQEEPNCFARFWLVQMVLSIASDAWRTVLHKAAPERLLFVTPGSHGRCTFFMRADGEELCLTWRIRVLGFMVMFAGCEIAFWKTEVILNLIPILGVVFSGAMWMVALVGAAGFTAATIALASLFYRPLSALVYLACAGALFGCILGHTTLLVTLGIVALCMVLLAALLFVHLLCPC